MSTDALNKSFTCSKYLYTKDYNLLSENRGITEPRRMSKSNLLNTIHRHDSKRKSYAIRRKLRPK